METKFTESHEPMVNLGLRAPKDLKAKIKRIADYERRKPTDMARIWLEDMVRRWEQQHGEIC